MATVYVDSAAGGANDGTSWTDAYTSILSADGAGTAAGDTVLIDDGHSETGTLGTINFSNGTNANPVKIVCVDKADDSLSTGAAVISNSGALAVQGCVVVYGVQFRQAASAAFTLNGGTDQIARLVGCTLDNRGNQTLNCGGTRALTILDDCAVTGENGATGGVAFGSSSAGAVTLMRGGTMTARTAGQTSLIVTSGSGATVTLEGVSIAGTVTNLCGSLTGPVILKRCVLPSFTNLTSAALTSPEQAVKVSLEACAAGTITVPALGLTRYADRTGEVQSSLTKYRTGGADDGEQANAHSWEMVSTAATLEQVSWLESPPIVRWVNAGASQTVTLYIASGVTYQDDELWVELLSPNESNTTQARHQTSRLAFQGTPANLTTDSGSTWNGTGVGTKQQVTFTISPAEAGPVIARVCLAKASSTVYIDPKLEVA